MNFIKFINLVLLFSVSAVFSQEAEIAGRVIDLDSESPIAFATVVVENADGPKGSLSDENGNFIISGLKAGRYNLVASSIGYAPTRLMEVMVNPGKMTIIEFRLKEVMQELETVEVLAEENREDALNAMALVSARQLNAEEARRYAGGYDDPARLVTAFAGVAGNVGNNGIVIRGNSPKSLLWRLEGMPISNPNHFAEVAGFGSGGITALSSQLLASSDFFTGAFPAEYGNALSGVFDINLRNGNNLQKEHAFQAGILGIDFASEGPFKEGKQSSYLFNYRYSTFGLIQPILPEEAGKIGYQDLSFKLNFPTTKLGTLSFWGLGLLDVQDSYPEKDTTLWQYDSDMIGYNVRLGNGIVGMSSKKYLNDDVYLRNTISYSGDAIDVHQFAYSDDFSELDDAELVYNTSNIRYQLILNSKLTASHTNRSGMMISRQGYKIVIQDAETQGSPLETYVQSSGNAVLAQAFTQSVFGISDKVQCIPGINLQYFSISEDISIEPRLAFRYNASLRNRFSFAYGKHSQTEKLNFYLEDVYVGGGMEKVNKKLSMSKAHHLVLGYDRSLTENAHFKTELYYQHLYDIPVIADSSFSMLNMRYDWFTGSQLINEGKGRNYGIEFTLERFMNKGWFCLVTASVFNSEYMGGDDVWRSTLYDQELIGNVMIGREWVSGPVKNRIINMSARYTFMGGERLIPVDEPASLQQMETILDYDKSFSQQAPGRNLLHLSFSYRINHKKFSGIWALQVLNALGSSEYFGDRYNRRLHRLERDEEVLVIPNLSYKIEW